MKVIDLIDDIRNKKPLPEKIKIKEYVFELDEKELNDEMDNAYEVAYADGWNYWLRNFKIYDFWLSDEVEIIEKEKYEKVKIIDDGKLYSTYGTWIEQYFPQYKKNWIWGSRNYDIKKEYNLIGTAPHAFGNTVALIQAPDTKQVFMFGLNGLRKSEEKKPKKIEKIKIDEQDRIQALSTGNYVYKVNQPTKNIIYKINELIDIVNKLNKE